MNYISNYPLTEVFITQILVVGLGGFVGTILRYLVNLLIQTNFKNFPSSVIIVNIIGSFIIGLTLSVTPGKISPTFYLLFVPGLLGGFTTYSAFSGEITSYLINNQYSAAAIYVSVTLIGGIILTGIGYYLGKTIFS